MRWITMTIACFAVVALAGVACGSSDAQPSTPAKSPPQTATIAGLGTPIPGNTGVTIVGSPAPTWTATPITAAQRTAVAQGKDVPLAPYTDEAGRFKVELPEGWDRQESPSGVRVTLAGDPVLGALMSVSCTPGTTVDGLIASDQALQKKVGEGDMSLDKETSIEVAGVKGKEVPWQGAYNGVTHHHWFVYFDAKGCTWRAVLTVYPSENQDDMLALFQRVLTSLQLT